MILQMQTKRELLEQLQERVGDHYFMCLNFCTILNLLREEIKFNAKVDQKLDELFELIKEEANEEIKDD